MDLELLKHIGESCAYSAKGHFKTADIRRNTTYFYVVTNIIFAVMAISGFFSPLWIQILSTISLVVSILLLVSEARGGLGLNIDHSKFGNLYLEIYHDSYAEFLRDEPNRKAIDNLLERMNKLNKTTRPNITMLGRFWAKYAIERGNEMTIWWN